MTPASARSRLLHLLATQSYEAREVVLSSGKRSSFYIDCRKTVLGSEGHYLVGVVLNDILANILPSVRAVGGLTMGADPIASAVATYAWQLGRPIDAFYIRKEPKAHGTMEWVEAPRQLSAGAHVAIVEDVCTTGASSLKAVERARAFGLVVERVISLVDREEGGAAEVEKEVPFLALFGAADIRAAADKAPTR